MTRFIQETFGFDFGDDGYMAGIHWTATVTIDTRYNSIESYTVDGVHACGKMLNWNDTPSDIKDKIIDRMNNVEISEYV